QLLGLALDLDPAGLRGQPEHEERVVGELHRTDHRAAHRTPESKPFLRASLLSGNSCHSALTTRRSSPLSLRAIAALPSLTSPCRAGRPRPVPTAGAASSKSPPQAAGVRVNGAFDSRWASRIWRSSSAASLSRRALSIAASTSWSSERSASVPCMPMVDDAVI